MKALLALVFICVLLACTKKNVEKDQLNVSLSDRVSTLDPVNCYDTVCATVVNQIYEPLYQYHYLKRPYSIIPLLAAEMPQVSKDGLTIQIKIKKNIFYHQSEHIPADTKVIAKHFINQFKRIAFIPNRSNGWWLLDGNVQGINTFRDHVGTDNNKLAKVNISGITAIDDHTLEIKLTRPNPQFLYYLTLSFLVPIPDPFLKDQNLLNNEAVGTGPYQLSHWNKGSQILLTKNNRYHKQNYPTSGDRYSNELNLLQDAGKSLPFIKNINFQIMTESQTRWLNFQSDNIDFLVLGKDQFKTAIGPLGKLTPELRKKGVKVQVSPTLTYWWLAFNMKDRILGKNIHLRRAIAHAVDIENFIKLFTNNTGQIANSIYPPGIFGYNPSQKRAYSYNLEIAKKELELAGYKNANGLPEFTFDVRGGSTTSRQMAEYIQKELAKINIKIKISTNTFPGFLKKQKNGDLQFWLDGWALDYPDSENVLQLLHSKNSVPGPNATSFSNSEVDKKIDLIAALPNDTQKQVLMSQVEEIVNNELPWVMLYYSRNHILISPKIKNFKYNDIIYNYFKYLNVKTE